LNWRIIKLLLAGLIGISGCYYDVEENLYPDYNCVTLGLSYQNHIKPILQRNCYVCHSAAANTNNITLEGYDELMLYVNNGRLLGAIRHDDGFAAMPQGSPKMIKCDVAKIEHWIADGAPDN